jgi:hypothetical protein
VKPGEWRLKTTEEAPEQVPGRPEFVARRVVKTYRASFRTGARIEFLCPCGETISSGLEDAAEVCGRAYEIDLGIVRVDSERVLPPGLGEGGERWD